MTGPTTAAPLGTCPACRRATIPLPLPREGEGADRVVRVACPSCGHETRLPAAEHEAIVHALVLAGLDTLTRPAANAA